LYELAINPSLQQQLREEVSTAGDPSFDDLNQGFPILDAFVNETLRIHPPIIENHHVVSQLLIQLTVLLCSPITREI
jgi:cytochrome P450